MNKYLSIKFKVISLFLMIMVITLHANNLTTGHLSDHKGYSFFIQNFLSGGLAVVAVPLFFLISSYLFFLNLAGTKAEFRAKISRRIKTLFLPYVLWSLWGMLIFVILQTLPQSKPFFNSAYILQFSIKQFFLTLLINPIPYQLWFVRDLMVLVLFSPLLYVILKNLKYFAILVFFILWLFNFPLYIFTAQSLFFFAAGGYIAMTNKEILSIKLHAKYSLFTLIWLSLILAKAILLQIEYPNNLIINQVHQFSILTGVFSVWCLYDLFFSKKDISHSQIYPIFSYTFFLYAFHEPILTILKKGLFFVFGQSESATLIIYLVTIAATITLGLIAGWIVHKIFPRLYAVVTGGR